MKQPRYMMYDDIMISSVFPEGFALNPAPDSTMISKA